MIGLHKSDFADDNNSWKYNKYIDKEDDNIEFPNLNLDTDDENHNNENNDSIDLPSPISTDRFLKILQSNNNDILEASTSINKLNSVPHPKLSFRDKTLNPIIEKEDEMMISSTPMNLTPKRIYEVDAEGGDSTIVKLLKDQIEVLRNQLNENNQLMSSINEANLKLNKENDRLNNSIDKLRNGNDTLNIENDKLINDNNELNVENDKLKEEVKHLKLNLSNETTFKNQFKEQFEHYKAKSDSDQNVIKSLIKKENQLKSKIHDLLKQSNKSAKPATVPMKALSSSHFGKAYQLLNMEQVDSLDLVSCQNMLKNIIHSLNVPLKRLKPFILFIKDRIFEFFKEIHRSLHLQSPNDAKKIVITDQTKMELCINILLNDIKLLRDNDSSICSRK